MKPIPRSEVSERNDSVPAAIDVGVSHGLNPRLRKPTMKASDQPVAISDDENGDPASSSKRAQVPTLGKVRGSGDVFIGVLDENHSVLVHATPTLTGPRTRVFHQDLPEGITMGSINVMSNGMIKVLRVVLDDALLTAEIMAKANVQLDDLLHGEAIKISRAKMSLINAYYVTVTGNSGRRGDVDDPDGEDVKVSRGGLIIPTVMHTAKAAKAKAVTSDGDETNGHKPTSMHVGWAKSDPSIKIFVKLSTHTQRTPYVLYVSDSEKLRGRLAWQIVNFMPAHSKSSADVAKEYFRSLLSVPHKLEIESDDSEGEFSVDHKSRPYFNFWKC